MTRDEIRTEIDKLGLYYDPDHPDHISKEIIATLPPPFLEWGTQENYIRADGIDYIISLNLIVRVYTDTNEDTPILVDGRTADDVLRESFERFVKKQYYDDELSLYETEYTMEV